LRGKRSTKSRIRKSIEFVYNDVITARVTYNQSFCQTCMSLFKYRTLSIALETL